VSDFYIPLILVLPVLGILFCVWSIIYLACQVIVFFSLKNSAEEMYRVWMVSLSDFRTLITLPTISVTVAILAGVGVNYLTSADKHEAIEFGVQLIIFSIIIVVFMGLLLAASNRPPSAARKLAWRLSRISDGLDDPFVSVDRAVTLRAELKRHARAAERQIGIARNLNFRRWHRDLTGTREMRLAIAVFYLSPLAAIALHVIQNIRVGYSQTRTFTFFALVGAGIISGVTAPLINYKNHVRRRILYGEIIAKESNSIIFKINRLEKRYPVRQGTSCRESVERQKFSLLNRILRTIGIEQ
jgi:uncharacterized membrane protein (DUF441 family)